MCKAWHVNNTTEEIWLHATWNVCTYLVLFMIFICKGVCKKKHKKANTQTYGAQRTKKVKATNNERKQDHQINIIHIHNTNQLLFKLYCQLCYQSIAILHYVDSLWLGAASSWCMPTGMVR